MKERTKFLVVVGGILLMMLLSGSLVVYQYGFAILVPARYKRNNFSLEQVDDMLRNHTMLFLGGPHRGGTTILWKKLREHPQLAGFGDKVGSDASEGIFMQTVYPQFGIGNEISAGTFNGQTRSFKPGELDARGLGRFAFNPDAHITEDDPLVHPSNRQMLFNEWSFFWPLHDPRRRVLLEKSPPNMLISRFLQELFAVDGGDVRFVFTTRHPIANALAHKKWMACSTLSIFELVLHWLVSHETLEEDLPKVKQYYSLKFEDFAEDPKATMKAIYGWLGVDDTFYGTLRVKPDTNEKYKKEYCAMLVAHADFRAAHERLVRKLGDRVASFGYDLDEYNCVKAAEEEAARAAMDAEKDGAVTDEGTAEGAAAAVEDGGAKAEL